MSLLRSLSQRDIPASQIQPLWYYPFLRNFLLRRGHSSACSFGYLAFVNASCFFLASTKPDWRTRLLHACCIHCA